MRKQEIDFILTRMLDSQSSVSDLNVTVGKPFQVESSGLLVGVELDPPVNELTPFQAEIFALNLINGDRRLTENLIKSGSCDLAYSLPGKSRFRVNVFAQRGKYSVVLRQLATKIPTIDDLNLPEPFVHMAGENNGIVFVTGATGSGKSTSLAAVLNMINENKSIHVVTLEDPVEFSHPHKKAPSTSGSWATDFDAFSSGLRAALRQAPKVILVGEMRDRETVEIGLSAAETGHMVFSTLHTVDAGQSIDRILGMFSIEEEKQVRARLAGTIRWIVCQRLLPKIGGGRIAAFDILGNNMRAHEVILNGESEGKTFYEIQAASRPFGMMTFDDSALEHYEKGLITEETAMAYCSRRGITRRGIDMIKSSRGEATTDIDNLELDSGYGKKR